MGSTWAPGTRSAVGWPWPADQSSLERFTQLARLDVAQLAALQPQSHQYPIAHRLRCCFECLYLNHNDEFRQFENDLINEAHWSRKDAVLAEIGQPILQSPIAETLTGLRTKLEDRLVAVNQRVSDCVNANIKVVGRGEKRHWSLIYPTAPETGNGPFIASCLELALPICCAM